MRFQTFVLEKKVETVINTNKQRQINEANQYAKCHIDKCTCKIRCNDFLTHNVKYI